jgi:hypothetical protein
MTRIAWMGNLLSVSSGKSAVACRGGGHRLRLACLPFLDYSSTALGEIKRFARKPKLADEANER